ncbi:MAG: hypothetical protein KBD00_05815 [Candidatus Peribacteraceae bacterium]|nr:hypothetical protein [Candidatus Peribacteraceae bacterium]
MPQSRSPSVHSAGLFDDTLWSFVHHHDDLPVFQAAYLVGAFLAALIFNIGFFLVLVSIHVVLDTIKYRQRFGFSIGNSVRHALVESLFDISLFLVALALTLYLNHSYGLAAISGIARTQLTLLAAIGTVGPKMKILRDTVTASLHITGHSFAAASHGRIVLSSMQQLMLAVSAVALAAIIYTPVAYATHEVDLWFVLYNNLVPWIL